MNKNNSISERKKKKKKKKFPGGLGWGDPGNYGAIGSGTGIGESLLRAYIRGIVEQNID